MNEIDELFESNVKLKGQQLIEIRTRFGMTQEDMAVSIGLTGQHGLIKYRKIEANKRKITKPMMAAIKWMILAKS